LKIIEGARLGESLCYLLNLHSIAEQKRRLVLAAESRHYSIYT